MVDSMSIYFVIQISLFSFYCMLSTAFTLDSYIGCFVDRPIRILDGKSRTSKTNSGDECIQYCKTDGYRYAGTELGEDCYCGHKLREKIFTIGCKFTCAGNIKEKCGGHWSISVYDIFQITTTHSSLTTQKKTTISSTSTQFPNSGTEIVKKNATTTLLTPTTVKREAETETKITTISTSQNHVTSSSNNTTFVSTGISFSDGLTQTIDNNSFKTTHNSQSGRKDKSSGSTTIIVPVILTLVAIFVIVLAVIVMKKRRNRNGDNINEAYNEPTEKAPRKQQAPTDDSEKVNNSHVVHNNILQESDYTYVNNEVAAADAAADAAAQSTDGFYEMLQHKVDSCNEYTTLEMQSSRTYNMIHQDGLYEMLTKENQPEDLYSNIKQNQNN